MKKIKNFVKAFSLIELMITIITVAAITAAFTPVLSKKIQSSTTGASKEARLSILDCADKFGDKCKFCTKNECLVCLSGCENENETLDRKTCSCISCSSIDENCTECKNNRCTQCNEGYYVNSEDKCSKCRIGHKCPNGKDEEECDPLEGLYQDEEQQTTCDSCRGENKYCSQCTSNSVGTCRNCIKGYKLSGTSCQACTKGTYQNQDNYAGNSCTGCSAGTYNSNTAETQCYVCEAGYKCPGSNDRIKCAAGYYSKAGQSECSDCTNEYRCPNELTTLDTRTPCEIGHYTPDSGRYTTSCTSCASGHYNSNTAEHQCYECPAGHYCPGGSDKIQCQGGTVEGHYQSLTGQASCLSYTILGCTSYPNGATSQVCSTCGTGYTLEGNTCQTNCQVDHCSVCKASDSTKCETCASGYYARNYSCYSCQGALNSCKSACYTINGTTFSGCVAYCQSMLSGCNSPSCGSSFNNCTNTCSNCLSNCKSQMDVYCNVQCNVPHCSSCQYGSSDECSSCSAGYYVTGDYQCSICPAGTASSGGPATSCTVCSGEYYSLNPGASSCQTCGGLGCVWNGSSCVRSSDCTSGISESCISSCTSACGKAIEACHNGCGPDASCHAGCGSNCDYCTSQCKCSSCSG